MLPGATPPFGNVWCRRAQHLQPHRWTPTTAFLPHCQMLQTHDRLPEQIAFIAQFFENFLSIHGERLSHKTT